MRHDYDFPPDWESKTDEEKCEWYIHERQRRAAQRQRKAGSMPFLERVIGKVRRRVKRRLEARSGTVSVKDNR